jgi:long-chain acyl-CoA synthetase
MDTQAASPWRIAQETPERLAIVMADTGEAATYGEMISRANRLAHVFMEYGLEEGDTVAYFLENQPRYLEAVWAAKITGLYYVCISRQLNAADVAYILDNSQSKALITSRALAATAAEAVDRVASRRLRLLMMNGAVDGFDPYEDAIAGASARMPEGRRRGTSMLYSSGTTGRPKGVRFPLVDISPHVPPSRHGFLMSEYGFSADTTLLNPGPYYHASPLRIMMHAQRVGATVIGFAKFDAEKVLRAIGEHRATHGVFVPTMFVRIGRCVLDAVCDSSSRSLPRERQGADDRVVGTRHPRDVRRQRRQRHDVDQLARLDVSQGIGRASLRRRRGAYRR